MYNYEEQARSVNRPDPSFQNNVNQTPASVPNEALKPATGPQWPVSRPVGILPPNYRTDRSKNVHMTQLIDAEQYQRTVRTNNTNQHSIIRPQPRTMPIDCQASYNPYAYYPTRSAPHYVTAENVPTIGKRPMQFTASDPRFVNGSQETIQKNPTDGRIPNYPRYATEMSTAAQQNSATSLQERIGNHHNIPFHDPQKKDTSHMNCTTCQTSSCAHVQRQTACAYAPPIPTLQQPSGSWPGNHPQPDMWAIREEHRQMMPIEGIDMTVNNPYAMQYFERKNNDSNTDDAYKKQQAESYQMQKLQMNKLKKFREQSGISQHGRPMEWPHDGHGNSGILAPYPLGRYPDPNQRGQIPRAINPHLSLQMHSTISSDSYKLPENLNYINSNSHLHSRLTAGYPTTNQTQLAKGTSYFSHPHSNYTAPASSHLNMNPDSVNSQSFPKPTYSVSVSSYPNPPLNSCNERYENMNYGQTMQVVDNSGGNKGGVPFQQELHQAYKPPAPNYFDPKSVNNLEMQSSQMAYSNAMYRKSVMESVRASRHQMHPSYGMIPSSGANVPGSRLIQNVPTNYPHEAPFVEMTLLDDCELLRKRHKQDEVHVIHSANREPTENGSEKKRPAEELRKFYENWDAEEVDEATEVTLMETEETRKPEEMMILDCTNFSQEHSVQANEEGCNEAGELAYKVDLQNDSSYTSVIKPLKERQKSSIKAVNPLRSFRKPAFSANESENGLPSLQENSESVANSKELYSADNLEPMGFFNEPIGFSAQENSANGSVHSNETESKSTPAGDSSAATSSLKSAHLITEPMLSLHDFHDISMALGEKPEPPNSEKNIGASKPTIEVYPTSATIQESLSNIQSQGDNLSGSDSNAIQSNPKESILKDVNVLAQSQWNSNSLPSDALKHAPNLLHSQHLSSETLSKEEITVEADNVISIPETEENSKLLDSLFVTNYIPTEHFKITKKKVKGFKLTKKPLNSVIKYVSSEVQKNRVVSAEPVNNQPIYTDTNEPLSAVDLSCKSMKSKEENISNFIQSQNHQEVSQKVQIADSTTIDRLSHMLANNTEKGNKDGVDHIQGAQSPANKLTEDVVSELNSSNVSPGNDDADITSTLEKGPEKLEMVHTLMDAPDLHFGSLCLENTGVESHSPKSKEVGVDMEEDRRPEVAESPAAKSICSLRSEVPPSGPLCNPQLHMSIDESSCGQEHNASPARSQINPGRFSVQDSSPTEDSICSPERNASPPPASLCSSEQIVSPTPAVSSSPQCFEYPTQEKLRSPEHVFEQNSSPTPIRVTASPIPADDGYREGRGSPTNDGLCSPENLRSITAETVRSPEHLGPPAPETICNLADLRLPTAETICNSEHLGSPTAETVFPERLGSPTAETICAPTPLTPEDVCSPEHVNMTHERETTCSPKCIASPTAETVCNLNHLGSSACDSVCSQEYLRSPTPETARSSEYLGSATAETVCISEHLGSPTAENVSSPDHLGSPPAETVCISEHLRSPPAETVCISEQLGPPPAETVCISEQLGSPTPENACSPDHLGSPTAETACISEHLGSPTAENVSSPDHLGSPPAETVCISEHLGSPTAETACISEHLGSPTAETVCISEHLGSPTAENACSPNHLGSPSAETVEQLGSSPAETVCISEQLGSSTAETACISEHLGSPTAETVCISEHLRSPPAETVYISEHLGSPSAETACISEHLGSPTAETVCISEHLGSPSAETACISEHLGSPTPETACISEHLGSPTAEIACISEHLESPTPETVCISEHLGSPPAETACSPECIGSLTHENETVCSPQSVESPQLICNPESTASPTSKIANVDMKTGDQRPGHCVSKENSENLQSPSKESEENIERKQPAEDMLGDNVDDAEITEGSDEKNCMEITEEDSFSDQELKDKCLSSNQLGQEDFMTEESEELDEETEIDSMDGEDSSNLGDTAEPPVHETDRSEENHVNLASEQQIDETGVPCIGNEEHVPMEAYYTKSPALSVLRNEGTLLRTVKEPINEAALETELLTAMKCVTEEENGDQIQEKLPVLQNEERDCLVANQENQEEVCNDDMKQKQCTTSKESSAEFVVDRIGFVEGIGGTQEVLHEENSVDYLNMNDTKNEEVIIEALQNEEGMEIEKSCQGRDKNVVDKNDEVQENEVDVRVQEDYQINKTEIFGNEEEEQNLHEEFAEHEAFANCEEIEAEEKCQESCFPVEVDDGVQDSKAVVSKEIDISDTDFETETENSILHAENYFPENAIENEIKTDYRFPADGLELVRKNQDESDACERSEKELTASKLVENQNYDSLHGNEEYPAEECSPDEFSTPTADFSSLSNEPEELVEEFEDAVLNSPNELNELPEILAGDCNFVQESCQPSEVSAKVTPDENCKTELKFTCLEPNNDLKSNSVINEKSPESADHMSEREPIIQKSDSNVNSCVYEGQPKEVEFSRKKEEQKQEVDIIPTVSKSWSEWKKSRNLLNLQKRQNQVRLDPRLHRRLSPKKILDEELKRDLEMHASLTETVNIPIVKQDINPRSNFLDSISAAFKNLDPLPLGEDLVSEIMNDFDDPDPVGASPKADVPITCPDSEMPALEISTIISPVNSESLEMPCLEAMSDPLLEVSSVSCPVEDISPASAMPLPDISDTIEENRETNSETFGTDEPLQNWPYLEEEVFSETPRNQSPVIETTCSGQVYSPAPSYTTDSDTPSSKDSTNVPCERNIYDKPLNVLAEARSPIPQLKCSLSWDKIFNLSKTNEKNLQDIGITNTGSHHKKISLSDLPDFCKKINGKKDKKRSSVQEREEEFDLELGPATIEVRLKPNGTRRQWNVVDGIKTETIPELSFREENNNISESANQSRNVKSPIVVVRRIILKRRAEESIDPIPNEVTRSQGPSCLTTPPESDDGSPSQKALPKVVIKRTRHGHSKYQSFLRLSEGDGSRWQPIVQIERSLLLENMVKKHVFVTNLPGRNVDKENEQVVSPTQDAILREASVVKTPLNSLPKVEQLHAEKPGKKTHETNGNKSSKYKGRKHSKLTKDKALSKSILRRMLNSSKSNTGSKSTVYNLLKPTNTDPLDEQVKEIVKHSGRRHSDGCTGSNPQIPQRRQRNSSANERSMPVTKEEAEECVNSKQRVKCPRGRPRKDCSERRKSAVGAENAQGGGGAEGKITEVEPVIFTCLACKFVFEEEAEMTAHVQTHSYHCQKCNVAFISEPDFERHLLAEHPDTKQLHHCLLCKMCFACADEHATHVASAAHSRLELTQRWTIQTLFALFTGAPCAQIAPLTDSEATEMSSLAETVPGAINYYHQPTPLQLAVQDLLSRGVRSPEPEAMPSGGTKKNMGEN